MQSESVFLRHVPCPSCGSSDAGALYSDGHTYCHRCGHRTRATEGGAIEETPKRAAGLLDGLEYKALVKRKLTLETCQKWSYGYHSGKQVAEYKDNDGNTVAQKVRTKDKTFSWRGNAKRAGLFGKHLWRDSGKQLIITEGEIDAMSVSQVQNHKWPVVSVPNGAPAAAKAIAADIEWLEKFERVVFMFDMDQPGREAANECAQLLSPGKAFIASLPLKDANEMLVAGRGSEIIDAAWGAKVFRPDGVIAGYELWERINNYGKHFDSLEYPWPGLQAKTRGCRRAEIVCWTAGSGVGKSEVVRAVAADFHDRQNDTLGIIALEESVERTALGLMGLRLGRRVHLDPGSVDAAELKAAFASTVGSGRYFLYDHWGSLEGDHLLSRIRYMVRGCGVSTVVLDHLSIVVSGLDTDDERKTIDRLMTQLRSLVQELKFRLLIISHVRRVDGKPHEEGGQISLSHLRGSGSIGQLSDIVIGLERNQQDPEHSNRTTLRVLKNRFSGELGVAGTLVYDHETGRLSEDVGFTPTEPDTGKEDF